MAFAIEARPGASHVVLAVAGDVDLASAPQLRSGLAEAVERYPGVVVDLAGVGFMDSTGLGVLVASYNRARTAGHRVVLACPQQIVKNALRIVQVDHLIDVYESLDDAVTSL
jgi:anti-sigma B factor antagonist